MWLRFKTLCYLFLLELFSVKLLLLTFCFSAVVFLQLPIQYHQYFKKVPNSPFPFPFKTSENDSKPNTKLRQVFAA